jgi:epsilon-lactone hydrolase
VRARLTLLWFVLTTAASVAVARMQRGPLRPGWSYLTELLARVNRRVLDTSKVRGVPWLREIQRAMPSQTPLDAKVRYEPTDAGGVRALWCVPKIEPLERVVVYFHGGGYVVGSADSHREIVARIAVGARARVLSVDYRLSPEHRFPAAQEDCHRVVEWLLRERGVDPSTVALAGDSAGGALALATLLARRDANEPLPACAALVCPWVDPLCDGGSMVENEPYDFGDRDLLVGWIRDHANDAEIGLPALTPIVADLRGLPPLLIQAGSAEILLDQITGFAESARASGVDVACTVYPEMFHDFPVMAGLLAPGAEAVEEMVGFLDRRLGVTQRVAVG